MGEKVQHEEPTLCIGTPITGAEPITAAAIRAQIAELNAKVVAYCVPIVTSNVKQYLHYRKDVSTLPEPMAYGLATSQAGSRSLEMKPFV